MEPDCPIRFLADRMLGRLGKWLCVMGMDCVYVREGRAEEIIEWALSEKRILLTRDTRIIKRRRLGEYLFITSDHLEFQLLQVVQEFRIDPLLHAFSRCVRCNLELVTTTFERAGARIPQHVRQTQSQLAECPDCKRFFWAATHRLRMEKRLKQLREAAVGSNCCRIK